MPVRIEPTCSLTSPPCYLKCGGRGRRLRRRPGCGFVDDALRAPASLPWTTLRVAHRAGLRPQAPQPPTTYYVNRTKEPGSIGAATILTQGASPTGSDWMYLPVRALYSLFQF